MKMNIYKTITFFCAAILLFTVAGCEYDVAEPLWDLPYTPSVTPTITQISPATIAGPGVNTITISGTDFASPEGYNEVYFNNLLTEVISSTTTSIVVRRPNLVSNDCEIKVVSNEAYLVVKEEHYAVTEVIEPYGDFLENTPLAAIAVDENENLYVVDASANRNILRVTPDGERTTIATATRPAYDAVLGPDGRLYICENNRTIDVVNVETGTTEGWVRLPSGRVVTRGDFSADGYFYCGGRRSRLVMVAPDDALTVTDTDYYSRDEIKALRIANNYVYLVVIGGSADTPDLAIWRNAITGPGTVGEPELVVDLSEVTDPDSNPIEVSSINISSDGKIFISTANVNPLMIFDMSTQQIDYFYKDIIPPYAKYFAWGNSGSIYMITGDTALGETWIVNKIEMGVNVAPKQ